ncbi:hypothetical protein GXM_02803 [Nostoc sphaeroides CCNUC1]|uniref:Uncharacterized protein n=1 Tax=Nostoc sphaeroides CCNUC1 TaxID=2653204 RepID=A0A5P8VYZ1_9NOSO|nr:hypothetical protein GXM_02803 [Nostoc sphaeroides CCNUC1]
MSHYKIVQQSESLLAKNGLFEYLFSTPIYLLNDIHCAL